MELPMKFTFPLFVSFCFVILQIHFGEAKPSIDNTSGYSNLVNVEIPVMARKAGGNRRNEVLKDSNVQKQNEYKSLDDDHYDEEEEDEISCPRNMFYHIRGQRCVPLRCRGGNRQRDKATGECMMDHDTGIRGSNAQSRSRYLKKGCRPDRRNGNIYRTTTCHPLKQNMRRGLG